MSGCGCGGHGSDDYMSYMQMMSMPTQYYPMADMPAQDLEKMYPQIYYMAYPMVQGYCDAMGFKPGMNISPTKEQLDSMVEGISQNLENQLPPEEGVMENAKARQPFGFGGIGGPGGFGRRRFLRDLISILLIRELLGRRRRPHYGGSSGYYGGY